MTTETAHHEAHSEKQHAALSSLFWALFLTLIKLGAGLATNSLGIPVSYTHLDVYKRQTLRHACRNILLSK